MTNNQEMSIIKKAKIKIINLRKGFLKKHENYFNEFFLKSALGRILVKIKY